MFGWRMAVGVVGVAIGVFVVAAAGATSLLCVPYKSDLMASWVQAIGSMAALFGALWIATRDFVNTTRANENRARMTATSMLYRLATSLAHARACYDKVYAATRIDCAPGYFEILVAALQSIHVSSESERLAILPLSGRVAYSLAAAEDRLTAAISALDFVSTPHEANTPERRREAATSAETSMKRAVEKLRAAMDELGPIVDAEDEKYFGEAIEQEQRKLDDEKAA